jgi:aldehyde:ferredoxin oxidoreductase
MIMFGHSGRVLHVDLASRRIWREELKENTLRMFIGGSGLAAKFVYDYTNGSTDPLGKENVLVFMNGPLTGTRIPLSGRHEIATRSPATGGLGESDTGGKWGTELRKAGYDGLVIHGRAEEPSYIWIHDDGEELRSARHVWGMDTYETDEQLRSETDSKANVSSIGPAGEGLALISSVMHDGKDGRAAARCGVGAVMGSKLLKAVVARGNRTIPVADEEGLNQSIREMGAKIVKDGKRLHDFGTSGVTVTLEQLGDLPLKNWSQGSWDRAEMISGQTMAKTILTGNYYCGACIIGCGREVEVTSGSFAPVHGAGPEYETVAMLGAQGLVDNLDSIAKAHELCNRLGMDVISTGGAVAFAMEAYEKGIISRDDLGGIDLRWGNAEGMVKLVEMIGRRQKIGKLLGEGVRRASERLGRGSEDFAVHVKGLEPPAHDPRAYNSLALGYATANRGACHLQGFSYIFERSVTMPEFGWNEIQDRFGTVGKGVLVAKTQDLMSMLDSLKLCKFLLLSGVKVSSFVNWLNVVTGWGFDLTQFMEAGERIYNLKRLYNIECGFSRKDDTVPRRIATLKRSAGGSAENLPPQIDPMLDEYYNVRGWDEAGVPRRQTVERLELTKHISRLPTKVQ